MAVNPRVKKDNKKYLVVVRTGDDGDEHIAYGKYQQVIDFSIETVNDYVSLRRKVRSIADIRKAETLLEDPFAVDFYEKDPRGISMICCNEVIT